MPKTKDTKTATEIDSPEGLASVVNKLPRGSERRDCRKTYIALNGDLTLEQISSSEIPPSITIWIPENAKDRKPTSYGFEIKPSARLDSSAFSKKGTKWHEMTMNKFLESNGHTKVCFDAEPLLKALSVHYGVQMKGHMDVQEMELRTRAANNPKYHNHPSKKFRLKATFDHCVDMLTMDGKKRTIYELPQVQYLSDLYAKYSSLIESSSKDIMTRETMDMLLAL